MALLETVQLEVKIKENQKWNGDSELSVKLWLEANTDASKGSYGTHHAHHATLNNGGDLRLGP